MVTVGLPRLPTGATIRTSCELNLVSPGLRAEGAVMRKWFPSVLSRASRVGVVVGVGVGAADRHVGRRGARRTRGRASGRHGDRNESRAHRRRAHDAHRRDRYLSAHGPSAGHLHGHLRAHRLHAAQARGRRRPGRTGRRASTSSSPSARCRKPSPSAASRRSSTSARRSRRPTSPRTSTKRFRPAAIHG